MIPAEPYVQAGFFYGLISVRGSSARRTGAEMTNVQAIASPAIHSEDRAHEADHPTSLLAKFGTEQPLKLDCGIDLAPFQIAYQTYGELNADRSNAILVCHALTGDQHVNNPHPVTGKPGWWDTMVGPGRPLDTNSYFIICSNVIGGCMGSTGPASINPATAKVWGLDFPIITIPDMVRAQTMLIDRLGIETLFSVVGGSMGGMQALQWTAAYPERVFSTLAIACSTRHSAQNIAFHELGRQAVMADPDWRGGRYFEAGTHPHRGLGVARMAAHITYLSDAALHRKFGRRMQDRDLPTFSFDADFQVESYLRYQGSSFVERFDANSYLYLTRAMPTISISPPTMDGALAQAFRGIQTRFCVVSFTVGLAVPDRGIAGRWCMRSNASSARRCRSPRSKPIAATMPSCSTCPNSSTFPARSCSPRARRADLEVAAASHEHPAELAAHRRHARPHRELSQRSSAGRRHGRARLKGA